MSFQEKDLEELIVGLLGDIEGFEYAHGDNLERALDNVLLEKDLRKFLAVRYKENSITESEIEKIILSLKAVSSASVYDANKTIFRRIVEGEIFIRDEKTQKDFWLKLIDFDHIENNIVKVCNQVVIKGAEASRIPDTIIYINGLPMIVWEYKSTTREDATIYNAYTQITTDYPRIIPELFKYNAFVVISDGVNSKMGSIFSDYEYFYSWRKVDDNSEEKDGIDSLYTMINGLFRLDRMFDVIHNFIYFPDNSVNKELKIVCNYPQYFAATKLYKNILKHKKPDGDGKGGTYFGTTGCGKSYGMLFLARLLMKSEKLHSPTIILITDRTDLDDQLSNNFVPSTDFLGDKEIVCVPSREKLGEFLRDKESGGIYLTTIQKFFDGIGLLSNRDNIICISDEAHRSQINLTKKVVITNYDVKTTYGYAKYLHDSLPNATFVGFTGTPIEETIKVFGEVVESYTMRDSIRDGITVRLVYDGRFVKAVLNEEQLAVIESYYQDCLKNGANEYQIEESKKKSIGVKSIIGDKDILTNVAKFFIEHYENRVKEGSTVAGKCMFVCADREIAWDFYNIVKDMRPEWVEEKLCPDCIELSETEKEKLKPMPMMKMVMTTRKEDNYKFKGADEFFELVGNDSDRSEAATQFKNINSNFKIAIVVDMWLTGFDVPFLDTIYIDKLLKQEHNIIQTISRVNRAFPNKDAGLIVDFIGIKTGMDFALKKYAKYKEDDISSIDKAISIVKDQIEVLKAMLSKFDSCRYFKGSNKEKLDCLKDAVEYLQVTKELENRFMVAVKRMSKAFKLCNSIKDFTENELDEIHYFMAIRSVLFKLTKGDAPDIAQMNKIVQQLVQEAIKSNDVQELFLETKDFNAGLVDLFDKKYLEKINKIERPNTKVKILEQLLKRAIGEFKKVNKIKALSFSERLKKIVESYNSRSLDAAEVKKILEEVAQQMTELMVELADEKSSFDVMGINYEEKAFYDVLIAVEKKYKFEFPEIENIKLAQEIHKLVTDKTKYGANCFTREDIKAELWCDIIVLLGNNGFPPIPSKENPEDYTQVYKDVLEQAQNFKKYYNN